MSTDKNMEKSTNGQQRIRKRQQFKKKYRHKQTISDHAVEQFQQTDFMELVEEKSLALTKKKYFPLYTGTHIDPTVFLLDYSILLNKDFKKMFLTSAITFDIQTKSLKQLLKVNENLSFIRQLTQLINTSSYLQIQNEQWNYYYHLGMTERIWTGRVSKNMAAINSMPNTYGRSKLIIEQRQKKYQNDLVKITHHINEYMTQIPSLLMNCMDPIRTIIDHLIHQDQYQLRMEIERRKTILKFDAYDHRLVQTFYNLKPRQTEIHSATFIWKAIHEEYQLRYEIALFKKWFLSTTSPSLTIHTIQDLGLSKINAIFTHLILDQQYLLLSNINHSTTENQINSIQQFIEKIIHQTISTSERYLRNYIKKIDDEKQKTINNQEKFNRPPTVDSVITAIEQRESNMVKRAQFNIAQTLKILSPTNDINESH